MIFAVDGGLATCGWAVVSWHGRVDALGFFGSKPDPKLTVTADREARAARLADALGEAMRGHEIHTVVAERMSFPPRAGHHAIASICLGWGVLTGIAQVLGLGFCGVAPKTWQRAVVPAAFDEKQTGAIDYEVVYRELERYVTEQPAAPMLAAIPKSKRSHPLDAVGVGVYASMQLGALKGAA